MASRLTVHKLSIATTLQSFDENEEECGWGIIKPPGCQKLRSIKMMLLFLCLSGFMQGMVVNGFINVVASTLERRFTLPSRHSGLIMSCYDIASVLCMIPVSYFGSDSHKPRWLGFGVLIVGLGSIVFSLPHFITGLYEYEVSSEDYKCSLSVNGSEVDSNAACSGLNDGVELKYLSNYRFVMMLAQFLHGSGASPLYTLGITYLDDNLPTKLTSVYIAIFYAMTIFGPAVGYLIGGRMLQTYCDFDRIDVSTLSISPESPTWVGAWWIGFLVSGVITICIAFPLMLFPKIMPGWRQVQAERVCEAYGETDQPLDDTEPNGFVKKITRAFMVLITNPVFILISIAGASESILLVGYGSFAPKFIESQFSLSASEAATIVGITAIPAGTGGLLLGGYLQKRLDLKVVGLLKMCVILNCSSIAFLCTFLMRCPEVNFAGVSVNYYNSAPAEQINLKAPCNAGCHCGEQQYYPVCSHDDFMFFSPCMAGCLNETINDGSKFYKQCACINGSTGDLHEAKQGKCVADCHTLKIFMPLFAVFVGISFMTMIPAVTLTLRCLPNRERSMGIGLQWIIIRCLGTIPAPILFGVAIDQSCRLWKTPCNSHGGRSCLFYNNNVMSDYMMAIGIACKGFACILFMLSYILYKRFNDRRNGQPIGDTSTDSLEQTIEVKRFNEKRSQETASQTSIQAIEQIVGVNANEPVTAKDDLEQTTEVNSNETVVPKESLEQTTEVNSNETVVPKDSLEQTIDVNPEEPAVDKDE